MQPPLKPYTRSHQATTLDLKDEFIPLFDTTMQGILRKRTLEATALSPSYGIMWSYITKTYLAGGKRLRPYLAYLSYKSLAIDAIDLSTVLEVAAAIELIHMAMLMHDDIIDRDIVRHGQANVSGLYREYYNQLSPGPDTAHYADSAALLAGDALISEAYRVIMAANISAEQKDIITARFAGTIFEVVGGELLDTEASNLPASNVDIRLIALLKTASYSCSLPLAVGAVLANATSETINLVTGIGSDIGVAFQMADDELGVFGDEKLTGKSTSSDLRERKRTLLLQRALELATIEDQRLLTEILAQPEMTNDLIEAARELIGRSGARSAHAAERQMYARRALDAVAALPMTQQHARELGAILKQLAERTV